MLNISFIKNKFQKIRQQNTLSYIAPFIFTLSLLFLQNFAYFKHVDIPMVVLSLMLPTFGVTACLTEMEKVFFNQKMRNLSLNKEDILNFYLSYSLNLVSENEDLSEDTECEYENLKTMLNYNETLLKQKDINFPPPIQEKLVENKKKIDLIAYNAMYQIYRSKIVNKSKFETLYIMSITEKEKLFNAYFTSQKNAKLLQEKASAELEASLGLSKTTEHKKTLAL